MQQNTKATLITDPEQEPIEEQPPKRMKTSPKPIIVFSVIIVVTLGILALFFYLGPQPQGTKPDRIEIPWLKNQEIVMEIGTSRVFEVLYFSGSDNRTLDTFLLVTERAVNWTIQPEEIATVDMYGRVQPLQPGNGTLKVESIDRPGIFDSRPLRVVDKREDMDNVPKRVINFKGQPKPKVQNLQKFVQRTAKADVQSSTTIPEQVKYASAHPEEKYDGEVRQGNITWQIKSYADGSGKSYVLRVNSSMPDSNRDKYQYFIGDRYLPGDGMKAVMITDDLSNGIWVVGSTGDVNHIIMRSMTYTEKALYMRQETRKYVERYGIVAGASFNGQKWIPQISDNDGLWTSLFGAGQLMRYSIAKERQLPDVDIKEARASALKSLKAVLMISNVAGRNKTVQAKIRHLLNTADGQGAFYQPQYLKKGKQLEVSIFPGTPSEGIGLYGIDAGQTIDGDYYPGTCRYTFKPINPQDWTETEEAATTKRYLNQYVTRTFYLPELEKGPAGGLWFQRNPNGSQTVIGGAETLYDFGPNEKPILDIGDLDIPEVLLDILNINGHQYNKYDIVYKGDTSTDQIIGHLFIYKVAYDILSDSDPEEKMLRELIRSTLRNFCQHLVNNGHQMVDATGQATKWAKLYRQLYQNDYDLEDAPLKIIQLLLSFKMAYYVTGEVKWKEEYDMITDSNGPFKYLQTIATIWQRLVYAKTQVDDSYHNNRHLDYEKNPSDIQIERHTVYYLHYSDDEEAFLAFYLALQLEQDPEKLELYRKGMEGYWKGISYTENPFYYYIYQLAYPQEVKIDRYGHELSETASWQLSRHPIDTRKLQAFVLGSRPDIIYENHISVDPTTVIQQNRTSEHDIEYVNSTVNKAVSPTFSPHNIYAIKVVAADQRCIRKFNSANYDHLDGDHSQNVMEGSTTYTLPYWFGIYHNMLEFN